MTILLQLRQDRQFTVEKSMSENAEAVLDTALKAIHAGDAGSARRTLENYLAGVAGSPSH